MIRNLVSYAHLIPRVYGASLSYLSADGTKGASSPQILADITIGSATEFTVMTDDICKGDCGFVRPGSVAYRELSLLAHNDQGLMIF